MRANCSVVLFFFSSRRRHTRCSRDWSSDVCSSDLTQPWAVAVLEDQKFEDVDVSVRFRPVSGKEDASGGIIFRAKDGRNRSEERRVGEKGRSRWAPYH